VTAQRIRGVGAARDRLDLTETANRHRGPDTGAGGAPRTSRRPARTAALAAELAEAVVPPRPHRAVAPQRITVASARCNRHHPGEGSDALGYAARAVHRRRSQ